MSMGRIEILYNGVWGTICSQNFGYQEAKVICKQLGYRYSTDFGTQYTKGTGPIWLSNLQCTGEESSIAICRNSGWGINNCTHNQDVGVICRAGTFDFPLCIYRTRYDLYFKLLLHSSNIQMQSLTYLYSYD